MSAGKPLIAALIGAPADPRRRDRRRRRTDLPGLGADMHRLHRRHPRASQRRWRGGWIATAYGPPWDADPTATGITATGLNLTAGQPALRDRGRPHRDRAAELRARHPQPVRHRPRVLRRRHRRRDHRPPRRHLRLAGPRRPGRLGRSGTSPSPPPRTRAPAACSARSPRRAERPSRRDAGASAAGCPVAHAGPLPLTPGQQREILPDGLAAAPADAPAAVKLAIAAGNQLIDKPYLYGGGHGQPLTELAAGYDCSGSTSYVLLRRRPVRPSAPEDSTELESYGQPGPGRWITVYANSAHAFIDVAGIVLDTAWYAPVQPTDPAAGRGGSPHRSSPPNTPATKPTGNGGFVQRHPPRPLMRPTSTRRSVVARGRARRLRASATRTPAQRNHRRQHRRADTATHRVDGDRRRPRPPSAAAASRRRRARTDQLAPGAGSRPPRPRSSATRACTSTGPPRPSRRPARARGDLDSARPARRRSRPPPAYRHDSTLQASQVANSGSVIAIAPGLGARGGQLGDRHPGDHHRRRVTTPACRRPCTSPTPSSRTPAAAGS